jgi:cytochrome c biogenesis factor
MITQFVSFINLIAANPFGKVSNPTPYSDFKGGGLSSFISNIIRLLIVIAGLYAVLNFLLAGYGFLSASGDPKKIASAWANIWQSLIGLIFVTGGFVIGAIISNIIFGDPNAIFSLNISGP